MNEHARALLSTYSLQDQYPLVTNIHFSILNAMEIFPLPMFPTWIVPIPAVGPLKPVGAEEEQCQRIVSCTWRSLALH